jgi:hypothetical protein
MNNKYYHISGYWKDEPYDTFTEYLVNTHNDGNIDEATDNEVFFYFDSLGELGEAVALGDKTAHDFVVTSYEPV